MYLFAIIEKLGVDAVTVRHGVEGLMHLMIESSKLMVCYILGYMSWIYSENMYKYTVKTLVNMVDCMLVLH